jgi:hypothetical protein
LLRVWTLLAATMQVRQQCPLLLCQGSTFSLTLREVVCCTCSRRLLALSGLEHVRRYVRSWRKLTWSQTLLPRYRRDCSRRCLSPEAWWRPSLRLRCLANSALIRENRATCAGDPAILYSEPVNELHPAPALRARRQLILTQPRLAH